MHDLKAVRDDPRSFDCALARRGLDRQSTVILELDRRHRALIQRLQDLQTRRNDVSKQIGQRKSKGENADDLIAETAKIKAELPQVEEQEREAGAAVARLLEALPNMPADDVPEGRDAADNKEIRRRGEPRRFNFPVKDHVALGERLGMDIPTAARMSGARFTLLKGQVARLERALAQFMLDLHTTEFGYTEISPPILVRESAAYGTGNLPKFAGDLFETAHREVIPAEKLEFSQENPSDPHSLVSVRPSPSLPQKERQDLQKKIEGAQEKKVVFGQITQRFKRLELTSPLYLIPTAEVPMTNIVAGEILDEDRLPLRFTACTPCFRSEAGAAGKDTHGMLRQHQFWKVELVSIAHPDRSEDEHQRMTRCAETVLERLELPYRTVVLCTGDMGFSARKTYDIEVWLPGQDTYREISSCSNCGDFQARRMNARFRPREGKGTRFVHTLNGSGLAVGRTLIAVLENGQQADGSVAIPKALVPYMGGVEALKPHA